MTFSYSRVEAAKSGTATLCRNGFFVTGERRGDAADELRHGVGLRTRNPGRRHFIRRHTIVNLDSKGEIVRVRGLPGEPRQIQTAGALWRIMAGGTVLLNEGVR